MRSGGQDHALRVCLVGKYPPMSGGTSRLNMQLMEALHRAGASVSVVSDEVEAGADYRSAADLSDLGTSNVSVTQVEEVPGVRQMRPPMDWRVARLASAVTDVVRASDTQLIFARPLEPYGWAAALASVWTHKPYAVGHAGSDIDWLVTKPAARTAYTELVRGASSILCTPPAAGRFTALGASHRRLFPMVAPALPEAFSYAAPDPVGGGQQPAGCVRSKARQEAMPVIGFFGRLTPAKRVLEALEVVAALKRESKDLCVLLAGYLDGDFAKHVWAAVASSGIRDRVIYHPHQDWSEMPQLLAQCDAVACLEERFPVRSHTPNTVWEAVAGGRCLVISAELRSKAPTPTAFRHASNCLVVGTGHDTLMDAFRRLARGGNRWAVAVGRAGQREIYPQYQSNRSSDAEILATFRLMARTAGVPLLEPAEPECRMVLQRRASEIRAFQIMSEVGAFDQASAQV